MTRDDIIRMAREVGWSQKDIDSLLYIVETAAAAEREACAKLIELHGGDDRFGPPVTIERLAAAIRARKENT